MSAQRKILVVDDDPVVGRSIDRVLTQKGYSVTTSLSGEDALKQIDSKEYDAVFTDIRMPGMSGLDLTEKIKKTRSWMPVVIITGYGTQAYEVQAKEAGVTGFLYKPLNPEDIESFASKAVTEHDKALQPVVEAEQQMSKFASIMLFLASPFIGLLYALALPLVGMAMLLKAAWSAVSPNAKKVALFAASPFVGLAYAVAMPFVGIGALGYVGYKAALKR